MGRLPTDLGSRQVRILLVDDEEIVRRGLTQMLRAAGLDGIVVEAGSVEQARVRLDEAIIDVVIVEPGLAGGDGIELCRQIVADQGDVACLVLTAFYEEETLRAASAAGAAAYLLKETDAGRIVEAIRTAARGGILLDEEAFQEILADIRSRQPLDPRLRELTSQERRVLEALGEGLTNRQIAERMGLAETTVRNYVSRMLSKLDMHRRTEAAALAARTAERQRRSRH